MERDPPHDQLQQYSLFMHADNLHGFYPSPMWISVRCDGDMSGELISALYVIFIFIIPLTGMEV